MSGAGVGRAATTSDDAQEDVSVVARAPLVRLGVFPESRELWRIRVVNRDVQPVRLFADLRLLRLLVRKPGEATYQSCAFPKDMKPDAAHRWVTLQPGQAYEERFDPRLICWGKGADTLVPGASVTAFFGFRSSAKKRRWRRHRRPLPDVVRPVYASAPFRPVSELASLTVWIPKSSEKKVPGAQTSRAERREELFSESKLVARAPRWIDANSDRSAWLTVRLENKGPRDAVLYFRSDDLELSVTDPDGEQHRCGPGPRYRAVVRDFFKTLRVGRSGSVRMRLREYCGADVFQRPGLYRVNASVLLREDGTQFGLQAVTGRFVVAHPILLRIRHGRVPWYTSAPMVKEAPAAPWP